MREARGSRGGALLHPFNITSLSYYDAMVGESVVGDDAHIALNGRLSEVVINAKPRFLHIAVGADFYARPPLAI